MSYPENDSTRNRIFDAAVASIAAQIGKRSGGKSGAGLVDWQGRPISSASYHQISRSGAKKSGSMKNWIPRRIFSDQQQALEREDLIDRSVDLFNNDPHMAGAVDTFASTIIGTGLSPFPNFTPEEISETKDSANRLKNRMRQIVRMWAPFADAGERMSFAGLQYLAMTQIVSHGECLCLLPMLDDSVRPYSLALQIVNPLRMKTPSDLIGKKNIRDGVEVGEYGQAVAYWIKKGESRKGELPDVSKNFVRIPARVGHRVNAIHLFYSNSSEQLRGVPWFAPAIKVFRDLNDYLDAELVSNIVTAAFSMFVEIEDVEPDYPSANMASLTGTEYDADGNAVERRYEELIPGTISYLNKGEKPHFANPTRPGATFEAFIRIIEKSIAMSVGIPHPVLMKDFAGMNYASYRSAMLEAWRVFKSRRQWFGHGFCQTPYRMLIEEAYLRGDFDSGDFYGRMWKITSADWIGPPKGQIEPVKEIQADKIEHEMRIKSRRKIALERGYDYDAEVEQIEEEETDLDSRGLKTEEQSSGGTGGDDGDNDDES